MPEVSLKTIAATNKASIYTARTIKNDPVFYSKYGH